MFLPSFPNVLLLSKMTDLKYWCGLAFAKEKKKNRVQFLVSRKNTKAYI